MRGEYYNNTQYEKDRTGGTNKMAPGPWKWILFFLLFAILVINIVGFATPNWAMVTQTGSLPSFNVGFFDVCQSGVCTKYLTFLNTQQYSGEVVGCILFTLLGLLSISFGFFFCFATVCVDCVQDCHRGACGTEKQKYLACAWFTLIGGVCDVIAVVWYYINTIRNYNGLGVFRFTVASAWADYSLILVSVSGGVALLLAFILFFYRYLYADDDDYFYNEDVPRKRMVMRPSPEFSRKYGPPPPRAYRATTGGSGYAMPEPTRMPDPPLHNAPEEYHQKYGNNAPQVYRYSFKQTDNFWRPEGQDRSENGYRMYSGDRSIRY